MEAKSGYIKDISSNTKSLAKDGGSKLILSKLNEYYHNDSSSPYSVKLVIEGTEHYTLENRKFTLNTNQFVVANEQDTVGIEVNTDAFTLGVCLYPPASYVSESFRSTYASLNDLLENKPINHGEMRFTQKVNSINDNSATSVFLAHHLPQILTSNKAGDLIDLDHFYTSLSMALVRDQQQINMQLMQLQSVKKHTKEELFRRLHVSKDFMKAHYTERISLEELAATSCLSKFHFIRSFKALFKETPYQFIINERLRKAVQLRNQSYSYTQIAELVGFSDSKNLKKALSKKMASL
jgi:AraC-like DNA-binding protein